MLSERPFPKSKMRAQLPFAFDRNQHANVSPELPVAKAGICIYCEDGALSCRLADPSLKSLILIDAPLTRWPLYDAPPAPVFVRPVPTTVLDSKEYQIKKSDTNRTRWKAVVINLLKLN